MIRELFRSTNKMNTKKTLQEMWSEIEVSLKQFATTPPVILAEHYRKALEDVQIIAAAYGTNAPLITHVDRPHCMAPALDTIHEIATKALKEIP